MVRQVAGAMARRVVCYAEENKEIKQSSQMGFIKFGSRIDMFLPVDAEILVEMGQTVRACETPIARLS